MKASRPGPAVMGEPRLDLGEVEREGHQRIELVRIEDEAERFGLLARREFRDVGCRDRGAGRESEQPIRLRLARGETERRPDIGAEHQPCLLLHLARQAGLPGFHLQKPARQGQLAPAGLDAAAQDEQADPALVPERVPPPPGSDFRRYPGRIGRSFCARRAR